MKRFEIIDCEQRSPEWFAARAGRVTGSRAPMMMKKIKSGAFSADRKNLTSALALEGITGKPYERIFNKPRAMVHGENTEQLCRDHYEISTGLLVETTGFLSMPSIKAGCSLDGHVNDFEGIVEFKCPESATHLEYLQTKQIPSEYYWQCTHNLWITGAKWCDFGSFDPDFPEDLRFVRTRMNRDEAVMAEYDTAINRFLAEVTIEIQTIQKLRAA